MDLRGKTVFITGAARGIGAESARRLAARGANVALAGLEPEELGRVARQCGTNAAWFECDVTDWDALQRAVAATVERFGGLDVVMANAGIATGGMARSTDPRAFEATLEVNLLGVWRTVRPAIPHVLPRRGYLLLVASAAAVVPTAGLGAYSASKAGVEALGRSLRVELRTHGVGVGVAYYLFLNTPMVAASEDSPIFARTKSRLPAPLAKTWPLQPAVARTVRGIERRSRAVAYPPFLRGLMAARGLLDNPLLDRVAAGAMPSMEEAFSAEAERVGAAAAARAVGGR